MGGIRTIGGVEWAMIGSTQSDGGNIDQCYHQKEITQKGGPSPMRSNLKVDHGGKAFASIEWDVKIDV